MNIQFRAVDVHSDDDLNVLLKGMNDPEIRHLLVPNFQAKPLPVFTLEGYRASLLASKSRDKTLRYLILDGDKPIGDLSLTLDFPHLFLEIPQSGWLGICISDGDYRGKGVGLIALNFVENLAWEMGLVRMELGVFAFNEGAIGLYLKAGYHEIAHIPNFVWHDGRWWADIRMEKMNPLQK
jgi:RimJ/RimL family protein N-acetyltransferase